MDRPCFEWTPTDGEPVDIEARDWIETDKYSGWVYMIDGYVSAAEMAEIGRQLALREAAVRGEDLTAQGWASAQRDAGVLEEIHEGGGDV